MIIDLSEKNNKNSKKNKKVKYEKSEIKCTHFNCCLYSSFIFIINSLVAYYYEYYIYSLIFFGLFITSIIYHSTYNIYTNLLDKISIISVISYGGWLFYNKIMNKVFSYKDYILCIVIITTFFATMYLFYYGYYFNKYCFSDDYITANYYHSLLHVISSLGHILIVLL